MTHARPPIPPLTPRGNYEPVALAKYLIWAKKYSNEQQAAADLGCSVSRMTYALHGGYNVLIKRAESILGNTLPR